MRDVTVDLANPHAVLDFTAIGILNALQGQGWVFTQVVDAEILQAGGSPRYKAIAVKALRNHGYAVAAIKARQDSRYRLDATPTEMSDWRDAIVGDAFSASLSVTRSLAGALSHRPTDRILTAAYAASQGAVIQMGLTIGMPLADITQALTVLP